MLTSDWHIHTRNSCDEASLSVADLTRRAAELGMRDFGITDHVHTPVNMPDIVASHEEFWANTPAPRMHFGIEASVVSQWELDEIATGNRGQPTYGLREGGPPGGQLAIGITAEDITRWGIEYIVGGAHWPMYVPKERDAVIRDYHRQNMFLATHPLVQVVAHPWWWHGDWRDADGRYTTDPWLGDFTVIPRSMHDEFAAAVVEHGKAVEINLEAMLLTRAYPDTFKRQYLEYLAALRTHGVALAVGSDCHGKTYDIDFARAAEMLRSVGIRDDYLWRLPPRRAGGAERMT
jgi:histidinol phosphatase-like PHP family hydrolase